MVSTRLCADTTGLGESRLSGPKACRTVDRTRTPWWHTREGDAAVCAGGGGGGHGSPPKEGGGSGNGAPVTETMVKSQFFFPFLPFFH